MSPSTPPLVDPLASLIAHEFSPKGQPLPLVDLAFEVEIKGGLALVRTIRTFHHGEDESLEAILVFPVPLRAALFALEVEIEGRRLRARVEPRTAARDVYENAISAGKTTVLHEEVLRGVHMLSIGHLPANRRVVVETSWAMPLALRDGDAVLRIPLTVGDIYGNPRLPETDVPEHVPLEARARLRVRCTEGDVWLGRRRIGPDGIEVPLDAPIDLRIRAWRPAPVKGRAADGREVILEVAPQAHGDGALDLAVLIDRSGSMEEPVDATCYGVSKHRAVVRALTRMARELRSGDRIELWQFDNRCERLGSTFEPRVEGDRTVADRFAELLCRLGGPRGGTELGRAIAQVIAETGCRDLLVITDGKSWELDVDALARRGKRVCAVLVGEDSLEAMIGHLAALTGGDLHLAFDGNVGSALADALAGLRLGRRAAVIRGNPDFVEAVLDGMRIRASWRGAGVPAERNRLEHAVAAFATSLALAGLHPERALEIAIAEGLVTHRTSLVLADEAGEVQEGLPRTVKIPLATPRTAAQFALPELAQDVCASPVPRQMALEALRLGPGADVLPNSLSIDWRRQAPRLLRRDLSGLDPELADLIRVLAEEEDVVRLARRLGLDPVMLVLALMARARSEENRYARRFAAKVLASVTKDVEDELRWLQEMLGLSLIRTVHGEAEPSKQER